MQTEHLFKISLIISITGILLLLLLANTLQPKLINIDKISNKMLNKKVKIQGTIFKIADKETFKIMSISDTTGEIDILCNCKNAAIETNQEIEVIGKVQEYNQHLQIHADKILKEK